MNLPKISLMKKNKIFLSIGKNIEWRKMFYYKGIILFRKFCFIVRKIIGNFFILHLCLEGSLSANKKCKKKYNFLSFRLCKFLSKIKKFFNVREQFFDEQFWRKIFWGRNFLNVFCKWAILKLHFLRDQFWGSNTWECFDKCLKLAVDVDEGQFSLL